MSALKFDEESHVYTLDGIEIPSVTTIIRGVMGNPFEKIRCGEWHMQRGSAAHAVYELLGQGENLSQYDIDPTLTPFIENWRDWKNTMQPEIIATEQKVHSRRMWYAGTLDLLCRENGLLTILDYKGSASRQDRWQLAAYKEALEEKTNAEIGQAISLQINEKGWKVTKRLTGSELVAAVKEWKAIRIVANLKEQKK